MKRLLIVIPLVCLLCFALSCQQGEEVAEEPVVDVEADIEAINEIWSQYVLGANTGDFELWISLWDDNGIRMAPDTLAAFGKEQIRAQMEPIPIVLNQSPWTKQLKVFRWNLRVFLTIAVKPMN